jgi:hypothetical protein
MMCNIYIVVPSLLLYICSTIKLNTKHKINKWKKTKLCRGTKIARNAAAAENQRSRFVPRTGTNDPPSPPPPPRCARAHVETHQSRFVTEPGPALVPSNWSRFGNRDQWPARTGMKGVVFHQWLEQDKSKYEHKVAVLYMIRKIIMVCQVSTPSRTDHT